jgi:hypothetical protein
MKLKAIMWMVFSGTATLCAFFLPGFMWTTIIDMKYHYLNTAILSISGIFFLFILFPCTLFHALYRIPTLIADLGFSKTAVHTAKIICSAIFLAAFVPIILTIAAIYIRP